MIAFPCTVATKSVALLVVVTAVGNDGASERGGTSFWVYLTDLLNIQIFWLTLDNTHSFQTDNGYKRSEDIKTSTPVEFRGGYSFISDDGYEYQVLYKANQNGFQPYVTAHKLQPEKDKA